MLLISLWRIVQANSILLLVPLRPLYPVLPLLFPDGNVPHLPENQGTSPFAFAHISGQRAAISYFNPDSRGDYEVIQQILSGDGARMWMDESGGVSWRDYRYWSGDDSPRSFLFAVHDTERSFSPRWPSIRGFVNVYSERAETWRAKRMYAAELLTAAQIEGTCLEISLAARPIRRKQQGSGVMSSALRLAAAQIKAYYRQEQLGKVTLYAFVDPDNQAAQRTILAAGFVKKGFLAYDRESVVDSAVYILSWTKLWDKLRSQLPPTPAV